MKKCMIMLSVLMSVALYADSAITFTGEAVGGPAKEFSAFVGTWHIDKDGKNEVYAVDGRKWEQGVMAEGIARKAKAMYGKRYAEFLDNLQAYKYFPLTIYKPVHNFSSGVISVSFKTISGRIDQGAGIAFNIKQNGDYLVVRANPLEQNLVLFKMEKGRRSSVKWTRNVPHKSRVWHTLKVVVEGKTIKGYVNGKLWLTHVYKEPVSGKIGLWSKADSYVFFDNFSVNLLQSVDKKTNK